MERRRLFKGGLAPTDNAVLLTGGQEANASAIAAKTLSAPSDATTVGGAPMPGSQSAQRAEDMVIADFESAGWGPWKIEGGAFGAGPVVGGNLLAQLEVTGYRGNGVASSEREGNLPIGMLTSPPFRIERRTSRSPLAEGTTRATLAST